MNVLEPIQVLGKLGMAAFLGLLVTLVHTRCRRGKPPDQDLQHAQVLLCVVGAMVVVIVGDSLARAFSIAGAAGIIRFRTAVDSPKDSILLLLLLGLGMACGLGSMAVAVLSAAFLCFFLLLLGRLGSGQGRPMMLELTAAGSEFPTGHVEEVLRRNGVRFEAHTHAQGSRPKVQYHTMVDAGVSLQNLSAELQASELKSVQWTPVKRGR